MRFALLFLIISCSSSRPDLPPFQPDQVCSKKSLKYLRADLPPAKRQKPIPRDVENFAALMVPEVRKCYLEERARTQNFDLKFILCHITGFDEKGRQEYYQFSSRGTELTAAMKYCLQDIREKIQAPRFKNSRILMPFIVQPPP